MSGGSATNGTWTDYGGYPSEYYEDHKSKTMQAMMERAFGIPERYFLSDKDTTKKPERSVELCLCTKHLWN